MTSDSGLSPADITNASFETKRRGYDPDAVTAHLRAAAETVTSLETQIAELTSRVDELTTDVAAAKEEAAVASQNPIELDEEQLADRIGQDAARVLSEARAAAADRIAEADGEAETIIAAAEEVFATRSRQADEEAARIRERADERAAVRAQEAEAAAEQLMSSAQADLELVRSEVDSDRESADAEASRIIHEAELARRQILGDLLRRRGAAKRQIEQLRAGRERLLASHEAVRRALDEITEELNVSMSEARAAAKTAGHSVSDGTIAELEAEIETARLTGLLDTGPVPVVRSAALPTSSSANRPAAEPADTESAADGSASDAADPKAEDSAETTDAQSSSTSETAKAPETANEKAPTERAPADQPTSKSGLADVVQLDSARPEVDTATHPAKGRNASTSRVSKGEPETATVESKDEPAVEEVTDVETLTSVADSDEGRDDSVGDLFASLRSESEEPAAPPKKKVTAKATKKKASSKKQSSSKATKKAPAIKKPAKELVDSTALARRLKRVLADEQSRAMSTLKAAEEFPDLDGLLNTEADHREPYWNEVLGQLDDPDMAGDAAGQAVDALISTIRRRVGEALVAADGDGDAAVSSLRNIYREIKTQQVPEAADVVCQSLLASA